MIKVNGTEMKWHSGMTVKDVLDEKGWKFPQIAVWIDDSPVPKDKFDCTSVADGSKIETLHMIAGG